MTAVSHYFIPRGTYLFFGDNLADVHLAEFETRDTSLRNGISRDILVRDRSGRVIGLRFNHLEKISATVPGHPKIESGYVCAPPDPKIKPMEPISLIAHWYNDFGLESTRASGGDNGDLTWYYWDWNFESRPTYDRSRDPILGWYKGDDANVLGWQSYWLKDSGVDAVCLVSNTINAQKWHSNLDRDHWIHNLICKPRNLKGLLYILWLETGFKKYDYEQLFSLWLSHFDIYWKHPYFFTYNEDGRMYPVYYLYEADSIRWSLDSSQPPVNTIRILRAAADWWKARGYNGVCFLARHPTPSTLLDRDSLRSMGVLYFSSEYSEVGEANLTADFRWLKETFHPGCDQRILNVITSRESKSPHPSGWSTPGSSPLLFKELLTNALTTVKNCEYMPNMLTMYNVAEWAEAGPGLQPNVQHGYAYLDAVKSARASVY